MTRGERKVSVAGEELENLSQNLVEVSHVKLEQSVVIDLTSFA